MRSKVLRSLLVLVVAMIGVALAPNVASATVTPLNVTVFQGNLTKWVNAVGASTVAANLGQADVLVVTFAATHHYGGAEWPSLIYGAQGCQSLSGPSNTTDDRSALISVLSLVKAAKPGILVFGYVSGPADAPDQLVGGVNRPALCGNNVNNYLPGTGTPPQSSFGTCPAGSCLNFVRWVQDWTTTADSLHSYINGIFIDYVNSQKMSASIRDNVYSYVHSLGLRIMANSTLPGAPCVGCTSTKGDSGSVTNYEFAADSTYLTNNDYVMVEGYWVAGFNGNGGVATAEYTATNTIAGVRSSLATKYNNIEPRIAALTTEPTDASFSSLSCSWSDFTGAKSELLTSAVSGDAIGYQFSDYGSLPPLTSGVPALPIPYCS